MLKRLLMRIGRRWWLRRIDRVLAHAYRAGGITSAQWHELDERLKHTPRLAWPGTCEGPPDAD